MLNIDLHKPIPETDFILQSVTYNRIDERLVDIREYCSNRILFEPVYHLNKVAGATDLCLLREGVAKKLCKAAGQLPDGMQLKIFDAWRPFEVQETLFWQYRDTVRRENPTLRDDEVDRLVQNFVSLPQRDIFNCPVHSTGGAVDLTIVDIHGNELDMGTVFDSFDSKSYTAYFESAEGADTLVRDNRRLLYNLMTGVGFTNLPSEWWHFDYGDKFWAHYTRNDAFYTGIF